ncbi:hypothetical protein BS78_07G060600 [Paspalum vaginatum]|nr:hypothetical protein BS78_07G060600 [Paspalum vaginatum]
MAAATSSVSLRLHLLRSLQAALCRDLPSARARRLQLRSTRGLETVVEAASYHGSEAAALDGDGDDVSAAELMMRAARSARTAGGGPNGRPGQPKEGGGGSVNATVLAQRAPTPPGLPAEGSGGQGGSVH